jgi:hypothetical protein
MPSALHSTAHVATALRGAFPDIETVGEGRYSLALMNGKPFSCEVRHRVGWVELASAAVEADGLDPWDALCANATLDGLAKITADPSALGFQARLDLPLVAFETSLEARLRDAAERVTHAFSTLTRLARRGARDASAQREPPVEDAAPNPFAQGSLSPPVCEELTALGWTLHPRDGGRFAVPLDAGSLAIAIIEPKGSNRRLSSALRSAAVKSAVGRRTLAYFVLFATHELRMVRAAADAGGTHDVCFEVELDASNAGFVDEALGALACAAKLAPEVEALGDEAVARAWAEAASLPPATPTATKE